MSILEVFPPFSIAKRFAPVSLIIAFLCSWVTEWVLPMAVSRNKSELGRE